MEIRDVGIPESMTFENECERVVNYGADMNGCLELN
jgi:hypothetical protein